MVHIQDRGVAGNRLRWRVRYVDLNGRERNRSFPKKVQAERFAADVQSAKYSPEDALDLANRSTVKEYAEAWRQAQAHRPSSAAHVETMLRRHLYPTFGDRRLNSIRPSEVQAWATGLKLAPATVAVVHGLFSSVMSAAVKDRIVASNPCSGTRLPRRQRHPVEPLTVEAVAKVVAAMPVRYQAMAIVAAATGLRQGEVFGLALANVDFLRREIRVVQQVVSVQGAGGPKISPELKTASSRRVVPLPETAIVALNRHIQQFGTGSESGLLFVTASGAPLSRSTFGAMFRKACSDAGVDVTFHAFRHHYASLLIGAGANVKVVQSRLGHATAAETLDTYAHLWPDSEDSTRLAVDSVLGPALGLIEDPETAPGRPRTSGA